MDDAVGPHQQPGDLARSGGAEERRGVALGEDAELGIHSAGDLVLVGVAGGVALGAGLGKDGDVDPPGDQIGVQRGGVRPAAVDAGGDAEDAGGIDAVRIQHAGDQTGERCFHVGLVGHAAAPLKWQPG